MKKWRHGLWNEMQRRLRATRRRSFVSGPVRSYRLEFDWLEERCLLSGAGLYQQINLVSDQPGIAQILDPALVKAAVTSLHSKGFNASWRTGSGLIAADGPAPIAAALLNVDIENYQMAIRRLLARPAISAAAGQLEYGRWVIEALYSGCKSQKSALGLLAFLRSVGSHKDPFVGSLERDPARRKNPF